MKKRRLYKRILPILFGLLAFVLPVSAEGEEHGLLLRFSDKNGPVEGVELSATYVGNGTDEAYIYGYKFADYGLDPVERYGSAELMAGYLSRDKVVPDHQASTLANGMALFPDLDAGDWLVTGAATERDGTIYRVTPIVLRIEEGELLDRDVKYVMEEKQTEPVSYKVRLAWTFYDGESIPESASVDLLQDGVKIDSMTLTTDEGWMYVWNQLEPNHKYSVVESEVPNGFLVHSDAYASDTVIENRSIQSEIGEDAADVETGMTDESPETEATISSESSSAVANETSDTGHSLLPILGSFVGLGILGSLITILIIKRKR